MLELTQTVLDHLNLAMRFKIYGYVYLTYPPTLYILYNYVPHRNKTMGKVTNTLELHGVTRQITNHIMLAILPSKTSGAIQAALPLLLVMCV